MVAEDLQEIIENTSNKIAGRKLLISFIITIVGFSLLSLGLVTSLGLLHAAQKGVEDGGNNSPQTGALSGGSGLCLTGDCLDEVTSTIKKMDKSQDPCQDFYQYACGGWEDSTIIPPAKKETSVYDELVDKTEQALRKVIEDPIKRNKKTSAERKLKEFFNLCIHDYGRMKDAGKTLIKMINSNLGGWYVLDPDSWRAKWDFSEVLGTVHSHFWTAALFDFWVKYEEDTERGILSLTTQDWGSFFHLHSKFDNETMEELKIYIRGVGKLMVRDSGVAMLNTTEHDRLEQLVKDVILIEKGLAQMHSAPPYTGPKTIQTTLGELNRNASQIDFVKIFQKVFDNEWVDISDDTHVHLQEGMHNFILLNDMISNIEGDKDRIFNNYFVWRAVDAYASVLSWDYVSLRRDFLQNFGEREYPSTWKKCLDMVEWYMDMAVGAEFIKTNIGFNEKKKVETMFEFVKQTIVTKLDDMQWLDNVTLPRMQQQLAHLEGKIAFPDKLKNTRYVDENYKMLTVNKDEGFFMNFLHLQNYSRSLFAHHLKTGWDFDIWQLGLHHLFGSFVHHLWWTNEILVPAAALQRPVYSSAGPSFAKFGGIGSGIAEEAWKAVDRGRYRWWNETYFNWWSQASAKNYKTYRDCYQGIFRNMTAGPFKVRNRAVTVHYGNITNYRNALDETTGFHFSYLAYKNWTSIYGEEQLMPALGLTNDQYFFVSALQTRCVKRRNYAGYKKVLSGQILEKDLMNVGLSQIKEFTDAFNCPATSKMASYKKCGLLG